jgi:diguanylate cyclase (GGDEF)-like protein
MKSLRVVYIKDDKDNEYDTLTLNGLSESARKYGVNLIVYSGQSSYRNKKGNPGIKALYGFIRATKPDGIIVYAWLPDMMGRTAREFLGSFPDTPVFFLGDKYPNYPYTHLRGYEYMRELIDHLVVKHGRTRVAFVSHHRPDDRDMAYQDYMRETGLWDASLYLIGARVEGNSAEERARNALRVLYDEGREPPDAIISTFTAEAVAMLGYLGRRGLKVPRDLALVSWEDGEAGRSSNPPLTCVEYPFFELGRVTGEQFFKSLRGERIPRETRLETRVIYRKSCGCGMVASAMGKYRQLIGLGLDSAPGMPDRARLYDLLVSGERSPGGNPAFIDEWERLVAGGTSEAYHLALCHALVELRGKTAGLPADGESLAKRNALEVAQIMLNETDRMRQSRDSMLSVRVDHDLVRASLEIIAAQDRKSLMSAVAKVAERNGIPSCHLFLLAKRWRDLIETGELGYAEYEQVLDQYEFEAGLWYESGSQHPDRENRTAPIGRFLDELFSGPMAENAFIGKVLHRGKKIMGLVVFGRGSHEPREMENLSQVISTALSGAYNLERLAKAQDDLRYLAENDNLTGLGNRYAFYRRMRSIIDDPGPGQAALLFVDLDGFKPINDSYGHDAGDVLLKEIAQRIRSSLGDSAIGIYRLGGDEFLAIIRSQGPKESERAAKRLLLSVKAPCRCGALRLSVSASVGCSHFPQDAQDPDTLLKYADLSMYRAKETKDSIVVFDGTKDAYYVRRAELAKDIMGAMDRGQIEAFYQNMYEADGSLAGIEALVRWRHPERGLLVPGDFLDIAVGSNMIVPIETRVLALACERAKSLPEPAPGASRPFILVNCSKPFFFCPDFVAIVGNALQKAGLGPGILRLGLEERFAMHNPGLALSVIAKLKGMGVDFAVDGMGGESSWINFLHDLPRDTIVKIDRNFVRDIETSDSDRSFLFRMLSIFESRGFKVAISGIESEGQRGMLGRRNCIFQGYALAEPAEH